MNTSNETFPGQHDAMHIMYVSLFPVMILVDFYSVICLALHLVMHYVNCYNTCFEENLPLHEPVDISPDLATPSLVLYSNCLGYLASVHTEF
jgi:hypothetical protein